MSYYVQKSGGSHALFSDDAHGSRFVQVPDPAYVPRKLEDGTLDPADRAPLIDGGPNPATKIHVDAVKISDEDYITLINNDGRLTVDIVDGVAKIVPKSVPDPTPEQLTARFTGLIQRRLDTWAQSYGYDGILSMATYAASKVPRFAREGQAAVALRDDTWAAAGQVLADVQGGARSVPTADDLDAALPALPVL